MNVNVVADVGNSRIKWGLCEEHGLRANTSLAPGDTTAWERQLSDWSLGGSLIWAIGGVQPDNLEVFTQWLQKRGHEVGLIARYDLLPLEIRVDSPERVGVDRLLNAVAANFHLRPRGKRKRAKPAVIIDAGTAVTVDLVSADGAFEGGAILPGRRLMAAALHEHTALLPFAAGEKSNPPPVGTNTIAAIETGIYYAVAGGINELIFRHLLLAGPTVKPAIFLTGGDAPLLQPSIDNSAFLWPEMTLEGLRLSAEAQP